MTKMHRINHKAVKLIAGVEKTAADSRRRDQGPEGKTEIRCGTKLEKAL